VNLNLNLIEKTQQRKNNKQQDIKEMFKVVIRRRHPLDPPCSLTSSSNMEEVIQNIRNKGLVGEYQRGQCLTNLQALKIRIRQNTCSPATPPPPASHRAPQHRRQSHNSHRRSYNSRRPHHRRSYNSKRRLYNSHRRSR
jgi:hypothetical protein